MGVMPQLGVEIDDDLQLLDIKLKQLKQEYEQYFLGSRKREPQVTRGEATKIVTYYANVSFKNTALRFRFNNLRSALLHVPPPLGRNRPQDRRGALRTASLPGEDSRAGSQRAHRPRAA